MPIDGDDCRRVKHVLVVEDEKNILLLLTTILKGIQLDTTTAPDGLVALDFLRNGHHFDLVITDIQLPKLDGIQLMATIKRDHQHVPVLVISAYQDRLQEARQAGADHSLKKPFSRQQL